MFSVEVILNQLTVGEPGSKYSQEYPVLSICLSRFTDAAHRPARGPRPSAEPCLGKGALPAQTGDWKLAPTGAPGGQCPAATLASLSAHPPPPLRPHRPPLRCRPLRGTQASRQTRVLAPGAGPHPLRVPPATRWRRG